MEIHGFMKEATQSIASRGGASRDLKVMFAPDFRKFGPYMGTLGDAMSTQNVSVDYLSGYRRVMPLYRGLRGLRMDVLHMHYPAAYFLQYKQWNVLRMLRFPADLHLCSRGIPLVYTVHDVYPLDEPVDFLLKWVIESILKRADALIVHTRAAREQIQTIFGRFGNKCVVIPHGDLSTAYGPLLARSEARRQLGLGDEKLCLVFGRLSANKGVEELIEFWRRERPDAILAVVGSLKAPEYGRALDALAQGVPKIITSYDFQSNEQLKLWFSAADCVAINYGRIYTSGVACLARSYGLPVLLSTRHHTIDLQEPHPSVFRFDRVDTNFAEKLRAALRYTPSYANAEEWRESSAWEGVAAKTREVYDHVIK